MAHGRVGRVGHDGLVRDQRRAVRHRRRCSDEPLTECPACEGRLRKVFNSVGVVFKGSGF
ncbi:FmdB family zinc ribbon protein, partial [Micromonospora rifamycinica]|uniref:FmdB family zinc ribbon protein n=1 Tax=Micromonospora rifamycinica TaxID=291594 RepID=UPI0034194449